MSEPISLDDFEQLLDEYVSVCRLGVLDEMSNRRRKLIEAFATHQVPDGMFRLEGNLFGAWLRAQGKIHPKEARNPERIATFMGELVSQMMVGLENVVEHHKRRSEAAGGN